MQTQGNYRLRMLILGVTATLAYALARGTWYTVKVTTGVNDGANNLEAPKTWSFKTR